MFDDMLVSRRSALRRSSWSGPISAAGHVLLIVLVAVIAQQAVVVAPAQTVIVFQPDPVPRRAVPAPPDPGPPPAAPAAAGARDVEPRPMAPLPSLEPPEITARNLEPIGTDAGAAEVTQGGVTDGLGLGGPGAVPGGAGPGGEGIEGVGTGEGAPLVVGPGVQAPVLLHRRKPEYPDVPRLAQLEGRVVLSAVISASGNIEEVTVLRSDPLFDEAAIEAVREWRYEPARQGGRAVAVYFTIVVEFRLTK